MGELIVNEVALSSVVAQIVVVEIVGVEIVGVEIARLLWNMAISRLFRLRSLVGTQMFNCVVHAIY